MGINIGDMFGGTAEAAAQGMQDVLKTGSTALGYLETSQEAVMDAFHDVVQPAVQPPATPNTADANAVLNRPKMPAGLPAWISGLTLNIPGLKAFGGVTVLAMVAVAAFFVFRRK